MTEREAVKQYYDQISLLDYMTAGSTVAKLQFELSILATLKARNANMHTIMCSERDIEELVKQVRVRVWKHAFEALAANRKKAA